MKQAKPTEKPLAITLGQQYPFSQPKPVTAVKCRINFEASQYTDVRCAIERYCRLKHENLIAILKAMESKKRNYIELYYEFINDGLKTQIQKLKEEQFAGFRDQLNNLCEYLISNNIEPVINASCIGFEGKKIKYFLSPEIKTGEIANKSQLILSKGQQILQLLLKIAKKRNFRPKKSNRQSKSQNPTNPKGIYLPGDKQPRNSSLTYATSKSINNSESHALDKIKSIDNKINDILSKMRKPSMKVSEVRKLSNQILKRSVEKVTKIVNNQAKLKKSEESPSPTKTTKFSQKRSEDMMENHRKQQAEELAKAEMRQTTKSPPKLNLNDRLHESISNKSEEVLSDIKNVQTESQQAEKKLRMIQKEVEINFRKKQSLQIQQLVQRQQDKVNSLTDSSLKSQSHIQSNKRSLQLRANQIDERCQFLKYASKQLFRKDSSKIYKKDSHTESRRSSHLIEKRQSSTQSNQTFGSARKQSAQLKRQDSKEQQKSVRIIPELKVKIAKSPKKKSEESSGGETPKENNKFQQILKDNSPVTPKGIQQSGSNESLKKKRDLEINERVRQAFLKSQATLETYKRIIKK